MGNYLLVTHPLQNAFGKWKLHCLQKVIHLNGLVPVSVVPETKMKAVVFSSNSGDAQGKFCEASNLEHVQGHLRPSLRFQFLNFIPLL